MDLTSSFWFVCCAVSQRHMHKHYTHTHTHTRARIHTHTHTHTHIHTRCFTHSHAPNNLIIFIQHEHLKAMQSVFSSGFRRNQNKDSRPCTKPYRYSRALYVHLFDRNIDSFCVSFCNSMCTLQKSNSSAQFIYRWQQSVAVHLS